MGLIEFVLQGCLCNFLVDNGKDYELLKQLINQIYGRDGQSSRLSYGRTGAKPNVWCSEFASKVRF